MGMFTVVNNRESNITITLQEVGEDAAVNPRLILEPGLNEIDGKYEEEFRRTLTTTPAVAGLFDRGWLAFPKTSEASDVIPMAIYSAAVEDLEEKEGLLGDANANLAVVKGQLGDANAALNLANDKIAEHEEAYALLEARVEAQGTADSMAKAETKEVTKKASGTKAPKAAAKSKG